MLLYGDKYWFDDVNRIVAATEGRYKYTVFTDNPKKLRKDGLYPEVNTVEIDPDLGTFNKIIMFNHSLEGQCLYLDLDIVIQKPNLDLFFRGISPYICKTYWKPDGFEQGGDYNSSVISWSCYNLYSVYEHFMKDPEYYITKYEGNDDRYLFFEHENKFYEFENGLIYSYMYGIDHKTDRSPRGRKYRENPSICLLNGQERFDFDLRADYYTHFSNNKMG